MSDLAPVVIESIEVRRAPGMAEGFSLPAFGPGINVVTGPNASGKSTTARLLHQLFWKDEFKSDAHIEVRFHFRGASWTLRRDGRLLSCLCNGEAQTMPVFDEMTGDTRDRYLLALHDLLRADDVAFARMIVREAAGGFDLEAGAKALGFQAKPTSPLGLKSDLEQAWSRVIAARSEQEALARREDDLGRLRHEAEQARVAGAHLILLDRIELALAAERECNAAQLALDALPPQLAYFRGDELETVQQLKEKEAQLLLKRNVVEQDCALAMVRLQELDLPPQAALDVAVVSMSGYLKTLETAEQSALAIERDRQAAVARRDGSMQGIAGAIDPEDAGQDAMLLLDELSAAVAQLDRFTNDADAQRAVAEWIGSSESQSDLDRLQAGVRELQSWLRAPDRDARLRDGAQTNLLLVVAVIVLAIEAAAIGVFLHPAGFALLVVPLILALFLLRRRADDEDDARSDAMNRFRRLNLAEPETWNVAEIAWELAGLQQQAAQEMVQQEKRTRWADLARKRGEIDVQRAALAGEIASLRQRLGMERMFSAASVTLIAQALRDWRVADGQARDASGRLAAIAEERHHLLNAFNASGSVAGVEQVADAAQASAQLQQLQRRVNDAADALRTKEHSRRELDDHLLPALREIDRERSRLLQRTDVESIEQIEALFPHYETWQDSKKQLDAAVMSLAERRSQLPTETAMHDWSVERVAFERLEKEVQAARYDPLMKEINTIEEQLRLARAGKSIEVALASLDRARAALRERREQDIARVLGAYVVEIVRQQSDEANLPEVARRARSRFSQITRGRYELKFLPGDIPAFLAVDTVTGSAHPLDQLSSATRVQLLLAVRAAFVETNERTAKLPLLLDETLANADESRAEAMIDAVFELANDGRQIFYFTAQRDEVEKWRVLGADHPESALTIIDLAAARHIPSHVHHGLIDIARATRVEPPAPNGSSRSGYRELLGVPPINLWANGDGDLHLWYLVTDLPQLHRLLCADVSTWGQVRSYADQKASLRLGLLAEDVDRLRARAELCHLIREGCRSGIGRPITMAALTESRAISDTYFERCAQLLDECHGNASQLVSRLRAREIAGFRTDKIDQLEDYFREKGHIVEGNPLDPDELRHRVIIEMHPRFKQGLIDVEDVDRLFDDLAIVHA